MADSYFNESAQILDKVKVLDGEISHYREVKTSLEKDEVEKLEKDILKVIKPKKSGAEIFQMVKESKITQREFEELDKNRINDENIDFLKKHLDFTILEEHYYRPILYRQNADHFQHILKHKSEIDFLIKLKEYLMREDNLLKKCDWWYFSRIDENIDKIGIPYFDEEKSKYRTFCPDFIFWLKKSNKYYLKFIDPKGVEYTTNSASKIDGFKEFLEEYGRLKNKELEKIDLFYFNAEQPHFDRRDEYRKYWTDDFNKIFFDIGSDFDIVSDLFFSDVIPEDSVTEHQRYTEYFPVLTLEVAATIFGKEQHVETLGWKKIKARKRNESLFIAHVVGKSMEPTILDGSWCLFRLERGGSRNGRIVLVESQLVTDPETNHSFTIKRYQSEKEDLGNGQWRHQKIILSPDNKAFKDIVLENVTGNDFRVVAEFLEVFKSDG